MNKNIRRVLLALSLPVCVAGFTQTKDYGLPEKIQDGNILHCFSWPLSAVKEELPNIAAAGFGAVQLSPMQRTLSGNNVWFDVYRPYDFMFIGTTTLGTDKDLQALCDEAEKYGIKIVMDVVLNHVDGQANNKTGYHHAWWNSNNRLRWLGNVNYNNRTSITHNQLGGSSGYPDVNSEDPEVAERAKSFIEKLKSLGVKGIRFDAAKHIALPSENCDFWTVVCSVPDMYYYGEILTSPGGSNATQLMKEYCEYMSVTDDSYSRSATTANGTPTAAGNWSRQGIPESKIVYWGESHDTYANNDGWSKNVNQAQINRGYAIVACRKDATALYLSRPSSNVSANIKVGVKGNTGFTAPEVAEVNKFRNLMTGRADSYTSSNGLACVTRQGGGAVIVSKNTNSEVSIANGSGYCPEGTYTDRVSGNTFTVTATTITGKIGETGIAVIYPEGLQNTGVEDIVSDAAETAEPVYYTLQGVKVDNPGAGLYIVVRGNKTTKEIIR